MNLLDDRLIRWRQIRLANLLADGMAWAVAHSQTAEEMQEHVRDGVALPRLRRDVTL